MNGWLIGIVTGIYAFVAFTSARNGDDPMALVFTGYAFANLGLIWQLWR
jgi:hypothetical protein